MRSIVTLITLAVFASPEAIAATSKNLSAPAPALAQAVKPALVQDTKIASNDSNLVKAAKTSVAKRTGVRAPVITNANLAAGSGGRFAVANESIAELPGFEVPMEVAPTTVPVTQQTTVDPAKVQAERSQLQSDLARAAAQAESEFADPVSGVAGGDLFEEGMAEQQLTNIPQQINDLDRQIQKNP